MSEWYAIAPCPADLRVWAHVRAHDIAYESMRVMCACVKRLLMFAHVRVQTHIARYPADPWDSAHMQYVNSC